MLWHRALIVYPLTVLLFRLIGRGLQFHARPYDVAVQVLLGSAAANLIFATDISLWRAFISLGALVALHTLLSFLSIWNPAKGVLVGHPHVLMENGRILQTNLIRNQISVEELEGALREKGYANPADVEFAVLEASGKLSVIPRSQARPVTPRDLHLDTTYEGLASLLISDGEIHRENLRKANLSEAWLQSALLARGVTDPHDVLFASLDTQGQLFLVRAQDVPFLQAIFTGVHAETSPGRPPRATPPN